MKLRPGEPCPECGRRIPLGRLGSNRLYREKNRELLAKKERERYRLKHPNPREYLTEERYRQILESIVLPPQHDGDAETPRG